MRAPDADRADAVPDLRHTVTEDGVTIAYQVFGRGPALVWLPSLSNLRAQWRVPVLRSAYEHLSRSLTVVLYDGRGTGSSDRHVDLADLGLDAHLRDLRAVVDAAGRDIAGLGPAALLGYYHSVPTAIAFAAAEPRRVSRMILFGGAARLRDVMSPVQTQALLSLVGQDWDLFADSAAQAWLGWGSGPSGRLIAEAFRTAASPAVAQAAFDAARSVDVTALLPRAVAPTLVLHRQGERQIPVEVSRRLAGSLPDARLVELPGSSPTLFLEDAPGDLDLVTTFVSTGHGPSRAATQDSPVSGLPTPRERDVLRLLAAGDSNAEIAKALGITVHTVERHVSSLYRKIGARGRADAATYALRHGLA